MKSFSIRNLAPLVVTAALICLPLIALAASVDGSGGSPGVDGSGGSPGINGSAGSPQPAPSAAPLPNTSGGTPTCNGGPCSVQNPLKVTNFCDLLKIVLQAMLILGLPVAVIFLVLAGLRYITAYGNPGRIGLANTNLMYTVIGVAIFLGAWTIAQIIKATLVSLGEGASVPAKVMLNTHGTFSNLVDSILNVFNIILPVLAAFALVLFFYGIVQYVYSQDNKKHGPVILWSLLALFILLSLWGILRVLENTFGGVGGGSTYSGGSIPSSSVSPSSGSGQINFTNMDSSGVGQIPPPTPGRLNFTPQ